MLTHPFSPIFSANSKILILGSFPSVKSRETGFPYGHKQNRFWPMLAAVYNTRLPVTAEEKTELLHRNSLALWDVIQSCEINGSSDASIKNPTTNDIRSLIKRSQIEKILCNGRTAGAIYEKFLTDKPALPVYTLPSTSPANAAYSLDDLINVWKKHLK